jgi:hypothetical protein
VSSETASEAVGARSRRCVGSQGTASAVTCDSCGEPKAPNVSTLDDDVCGWILLSPGCPELEPEDLVEAGVPQALAGRLARLIDHYVDAEEACTASRCSPPTRPATRRAAPAAPVWRRSDPLRRRAGIPAGNKLVVRQGSTPAGQRAGRRVRFRCGAGRTMPRRARQSAQGGPREQEEGQEEGQEKEEEGQEEVT